MGVLTDSGEIVQCEVLTEWTDFTVWGSDRVWTDCKMWGIDRQWRDCTVWGTDRVDRFYTVGY